MSNPLEGMNILNLADRLNTDVSARNFLTLLAVGPKIRMQLQEVLSAMAPNEQKALVCLVGFRMMGAMLPASLEMIRRLPPFEGIHPENIGIAFDYLVSNDVLEFIHDDKSGEGAFHWASLDRLVSAALAEADAPKLLGPDGQPTTGLLFQ